MKRMARFFSIAGDALGLVLLLGGLMVATNNARSVKTRPAKVRRANPHASALNAREARAAA